MIRKSKYLLALRMAICHRTLKCYSCVIARFLAILSRTDFQNQVLYASFCTPAPFGGFCAVLILFTKFFYQVVSFSLSPLLNISTFGHCSLVVSSSICPRTVWIITQLTILSNDSMLFCNLLAFSELRHVPSLSVFAA